MRFDKAMCHPERSRKIVGVMTRKSSFDLAQDAPRGFSRSSIIKYTLVLGLAAALLVSCSPSPETGPGEVRWDREICTRCSMAIGDLYYSAQVRGLSERGDRTQLYYFDDFGCATRWLDKQDWKSDPRIEVWVNDYRDGVWIDGIAAWYVPGKMTPMDYGLGATVKQEVGAMNYEAAVAHVLRPEHRDAHRMQERKHP